MAAKRHHASKKRHHDPRHLSAHDRAVDRANLKHARADRQHGPEHMDLEYAFPSSKDKHLRHHSSSMENHGGWEDPEHFRPYARGVEPAEPAHYVDPAAYSVESARRTQAMQAGGMIHSDWNQIANLPQQSRIEPYRRTGPYNPEVLDDTIAGVDRQMDYDDHKRAQSFYPKKV